MLKTLNSLGMLLFFVIVCFALSEIGDAITTEQAYNWYSALQKPDWLWVFPNFVFPIIWIAAYLILALSGWMVWLFKKPGYRIALIFWGIQLLLTAAWVPLFFGQQEILYGLVLLDVLWVFVLTTTIIFYRHSKIAAFLMLLYLGWITYAGVLNFTIWQMNT